MSEGGSHGRTGSGSKNSFRGGNDNEKTESIPDDDTKYRVSGGKSNNGRNSGGGDGGSGSGSGGAGGGGDNMSREERDKLGGLTVPQLRARLEIYSRRVPRGMVKEELMQLLAQVMRGESIPPPIVTSQQQKPRTSKISRQSSGGGDVVVLNERSKLMLLTVPELKKRIVALGDRTIRSRAPKSDLVALLLKATRGTKSEEKEERKGEKEEKYTLKNSIRGSRYIELEKSTKEQLRDRLVMYNIALPGKNTLKSKLINMVMIAEKKEKEKEQEEDDNEETETDEGSSSETEDEREKEKEEEEREEEKIEKHSKKKEKEESTTTILKRLAHQATEVGDASTVLEFVQQYADEYPEIMKRALSEAALQDELQTISNRPSDTKKSMIFPMSELALGNFGAYLAGSGYTAKDIRTFSSYAWRRIYHGWEFEFENIPFNFIDGLRSDPTLRLT